MGVGHWPQGEMGGGGGTRKGEQAFGAHLWLGMDSMILVENELVQTDGDGSGDNNSRNG